jgi:hypothetical protein
MPIGCSTRAFSGKENTQYQAAPILDARLGGNDMVSSYLEVPSALSGLKI